MDERVKPGQLHEQPGEINNPDTYPEEGEVDFGMRPASCCPPPDPAPTTHACDEGSSGELRREREASAESGGYDDPRYGKVRSFPSQS